MWFDLESMGEASTAPHIRCAPFDVELQRRVIVSTQRLGFADVIANQGVAVAQYAASNPV